MFVRMFEQCFGLSTNRSRCLKQDQQTLGKCCQLLYVIVVLSAQILYLWTIQPDIFSDGLVFPSASGSMPGAGIPLCTNMASLLWVIGLCKNTLLSDWQYVCLATTLHKNMHTERFLSQSCSYAVLVAGWEFCRNSIGDLRQCFFSFFPAQKVHKVLIVISMLAQIQPDV